MAPSDSKIELALRAQVRRCFACDDLDALTLKRVRAVAAAELHLAPDFFKAHDVWNGRSKTVVTAEVEAQERARDGDDDDVGDVNNDASDAAEEQAQGGEDEDGDSTVAFKDRKKSKKESHSADDKSADDQSDISDLAPKKRKLKATSKTSKPSKRRKSSTPVSDASPGVESGDDHESMVASDQEPARAGQAEPKGDSESEMSEVLDDTPPPAKRKKKSLSSAGNDVAKKSKSKAPAKTTKPSKQNDMSPQEAEIKKLQGWLVKCGVRKVWAIYLKPYETPKEKIAHLKGMLREVGMEGRFSEDKARNIKERRELEADLEAVQEGEKNWGVDEDDGDDNAKDSTKEKPRRRLAKGLAELARFDDSETSDD